eukprot:6206965-Pleurochrysis_carterae.AAC.1
MVKLLSTGEVRSVNVRHGTSTSKIQKMLCSITLSKKLRLPVVLATLATRMMVSATIALMGLRRRP